VDEFMNVDSGGR